jgi:hypothetical protein
VAAATAHELAHGLDVVTQPLLGLHKVGRNTAEQNLIECVTAKMDL